jgi:hypothetical protein
VVPYLPGGNNAYKRPRVALEMTILCGGRLVALMSVDNTARQFALFERRELCRCVNAAT